MIDRVRAAIRAYRKRFGLFGLLFPFLILLGGGSIVLVCLSANGFDVIAWLTSPKAAVAYFGFLIFALALAAVWTSA